MVRCCGKETKAACALRPLVDFELEARRGGGRRELRPTKRPSRFNRLTRLGLFSPSYVSRCSRARESFAGSAASKASKQATMVAYNDVFMLE